VVRLASLCASEVSRERRKCMLRRISLTLITLSLMLGPRLGFAQGTLLWQRDINGIGIANDDDQAAVTVDHQGNVLAAGRTGNTDTGFDFTVAKFDRNGPLLWQQTLNGTANASDQVLSVAVDNQGNVLAAGATTNTDTSFDFTVAKFDR
jgi:hypothetical protein